MSAANFRDEAVMKLFDGEYEDDTFTCVARWTLFDEQIGQQELVTAEIYTNGNRWGVRAWSFHRTPTPAQQSVRFIGIKRDGRDPTLFTAEMLIEADDLMPGGAVMISQEMANALIERTKAKLTGGAQ